MRFAAHRPGNPDATPPATACPAAAAPAPDAPPPPPPRAPPPPMLLAAFTSAWQVKLQVAVHAGTCGLTATLAIQGADVLPRPATSTCPA